MKKILTLSILLVLSIIAFAQKDSTQAKRTPEERAQQMTQALSKRLTLSEEQRSKIYALQLGHLKKIEEAKEKKVKGEKGGMKGSMDELDTQINNVLTDEQKKQQEEFKKQRQAKMEERKVKDQNKEKSDKVEKTKID